MTIAALVGFAVSAQFVSVEALEVPYYVALLGAGSILVYSRMVEDGEFIVDPIMAMNDQPDWRTSVDQYDSMPIQGTGSMGSPDMPPLILN